MGKVGKIIAGGALIAASFFIPAGFTVLGLKLLTAAFVGGLGASLALGGISQALTRAPKANLLHDSQGRLVSVRQPAAPSRIIYGNVRTGGVITYLRTMRARNEVLLVVFTLCAHELHAINGIYFDGEYLPLTNGVPVGTPYENHVYVEFNYGYHGKQGFPSLANDSDGEWTSSHWQQGHAGVYVRLFFKEDLFPKGLPNITFDVDGKHVFDPRAADVLAVTGATNASPIVIASAGHGRSTGASVRIEDVGGNTAANGTFSITVVDADHFSLDGTTGNGAYTSGGSIYPLSYSNNAALVIADAMTDPLNGLPADYSTEIDEDVLTASANVCDEDVDIPGSTTEKRYTINGVYESTDKPGEILQQMAGAMAGWIPYIGGKFHIIAGAYRLPVLTLAEDDFVSGMSIKARRSKRDLFNAVKGTFVSPDHEWQTTDFPAVLDATYQTEDGGERVFKDVHLPFTTSPYRAQRISKVELERNRRHITVDVDAKMRALELQAGDVVALSSTRLGWVEKPFEVHQLELKTVGQGDSRALAVGLHLQEVDVDVYGYTVDDYGQLIEAGELGFARRPAPYPWSPGSLATHLSTNATRLREFSDYSFGIAQRYKNLQDGSALAQLTLIGSIPPNVLSESVRRPAASLTAATASTGGFLTGDETYFIAVAALDDITGGDFAGRFSGLSQIAKVVVPAGTDTNTVTIQSLTWAAGTVGWALYFGTDPDNLSYQTAYLGSVPTTTTVTGPDATPTSITFKGFNVASQLPDGYYRRLRGAPDRRFHHVVIRATRAKHLGIWGGAVDTVVDADEIKLAVSPSFDTDALAGRYLALVGVDDAGLMPESDSGMSNAYLLIASNTGDTVTISSGQTVPSDLVAGATVVVTTKATAVSSDSTGNYIQDTGFGQGGQNLADEEGGDGGLKGCILRLIAGTGAGHRYVIKDNVGTKVYIEGDWEVTPDTTTVFIITEPTPIVTQVSEELPSAAAAQFTQFRLDVANLAGQQLLIEVAAANWQGKESDPEKSPWRWIYVRGDQGIGTQNSGILAAENFPGADWGAKVVAARDALPAGWCVVDATSMTGAQSCSVNPFDGWTGPLVIRIGDAVVSTTEPWVSENPHQGLVGTHVRSVVKYTGTSGAVAVLFDGTGGANGYQFVVDGLRVDANGLATDAVQFKRAKGSVIKDLSATNCSGAGIRVSGSVECTLINPTVSANLENFTTMPSVGLQVDDIGAVAGDFSSACTIIGMAMDGITGTLGYGVYDKSANNVYLGGGSEANKVGICFGGTNSQNNSVLRVDLESNTTHDVLLDGAFLCELHGVSALSSLAASLKIKGSAYLNKVFGGRFNSVVIDSGCTENQVHGAMLQSTGLTAGTAWSDSGTGTVRNSVYDNAVGRLNDYSPFKRRELFLQNDAGDTVLTIKANGSQSGALLLITDAAGNTYVKVEANAIFAGVVRIADGDTSIWHLSAGGSNELVFTRSGVAARWEMQSGGALVPSATGTDVGSSSKRVNVWGHDADFDNAVTLSGQTASKPVFTNASKALGTQNIDLAASYVVCTNTTTARTLIAAAQSGVNTDNATTGIT